MYLCLACKCPHGWEDPKKVKNRNYKMVTRHHRGMGEDIWYCPNCNKEHRTHDGSAFGQVTKQWKQIDNNDQIPVKTFFDGDRLISINAKGEEIASESKWAMFRM